MKNKILYWLPRILTIIFILFISMFALDSFEEELWFIALFMHLIPTFTLIAITILAWKKEKIGGMVFILIAIVFTLFFKLYNDFVSFLLIGFPPAIIGVLFILSKQK